MTTEPIIGRTFISMDGRQHQLYRKLAMPAFQSSAIARFNEHALVDLEDIVTFGFGVKFCPGSHLARRELLTALDAVLERLPGLRLVDADGAAPEGGTLRHPRALRVAWDA